jgi:riboflavin kinase/FMN adenylyltransferase
MKLSGHTISGEGRGKQIGFPTINIILDQNVPKKGVFAAVGTLHKKAFSGIVHVGPRPTVNDTKTCVEIHIFDWQKQVKNNTQVTFEIIGDKIRETKKFTSLQQLKNQIQKDCKKARRILEDFQVLQ